MSHVVVLYRPNTDHETLIRDLMYNYQHQTGKTLDLLSLDTKEGADLATLYGVSRYPAIIARDNEGRMLQLWQDDHLPLIQEIAYYDQPD